MAATLSSLWGRAQGNKRLLPEQAGGCVDLTAEGEAGKPHLSNKPNSPVTGRTASSAPGCSIERQQPADSVHDSKRRRLDTQPVDAQV